MYGPIPSCVCMGDVTLYGLQLSVQPLFDITNSDESLSKIGVLKRAVCGGVLQTAGLREGGWLRVKALPTVAWNRRMSRRRRTKAVAWKVCSMSGCSE